MKHGSLDEMAVLAAEKSADIFLTQRRFLVEHSAETLGLGNALAVREGARLWLLHLSFFPSGRLPHLEPTQIQLLDPLGEAVTNIEVRRLETAGLRSLELEKDHVAEDEILLGLFIEDSEAARRLAIDTTDYFVQLVDIENLDPFFSRAPLRFSSHEDIESPDSVEPSDRLPQVPEDVDYLAKDYESFRTLMLDHMARTVPDWVERNPSDLGITITEVLAYAGDYLSYFQDAVGTEAYLQTARRRVSIRRHGMLLDYPLSEGYTPRAWIQVQLGEAESGPADQPIWLPQGAQFLSDCGIEAVVPYPSHDYEKAVRDGADAFETLYGVALRPSMNHLEIYPWRVSDYDLKAGSTSAALYGDYCQQLDQGDVLLFEQVISNISGLLSQVDLSKRQVVRLKSKPRLIHDPLEPSCHLTEIEWYSEDALAFALPVRRHQTGKKPLAAVRGNLVLADLGRTTFEQLPQVPFSRPYRPRLDEVGERYQLVYHQPYILDSAVYEPASAALKQRQENVIPALMLAQLDESSWIEQGTVLDPIDSRRWAPKRDLVRSGRFERSFVVETENDGTVTLRFGDGDFGQRPEPASFFWAFYRVADSTRSAVGAGTSAHLVTTGATVDGSAPVMSPQLEVQVQEACFPVGAFGGADAETDGRARLFAPAIVNTQERVVTAEDFIQRACQQEEVLDAYARLEWGGSWTLAVLRVHRAGGRLADEAFRARVQAEFRGRLIMGYQLTVKPPRWLPLDIALRVRMKAHAEKRLVERRLKQALGTGSTSDGELAFFNSDCFGFGQDVELDELVNAALAVDGVLDVEVTRFQSLAAATGQELQEGLIRIAAEEIAELTPDYGKLEIAWVPSR